MFSDLPASAIMASHKTETEDKTDSGKPALSGFSSGISWVRKCYNFTCNNVDIFIKSVLLLLVIRLV